MKKIRINELARECEQPNSVIIAILPQFGVTEKKTHSSSIDEDVADAIRRHYGVFVEQREAAAPAEEGETASAPGPTEAVVETAPKAEPETPERPAAKEEEGPEQRPVEAAPGGPEPTGLTAEE
jgi:translation initiation factor IF-2